MVLDKRKLKTNKRGKQLNIYIANDLGFCGNFNSNVNKIMKEDLDSEKIVIGKKIIKDDKNVLLAITKEEYKDNVKEIEKILLDSISNNKHKEINIIYNHYYNISEIDLVKKKILPIDRKKKDKDSYHEDFIIEGDINKILINLIVLYLSYEIRVAEENSYASENIMRQMITKQSLDKLKEINEEKKRERLKINKQKSIKKTLENYVNDMSKEK